MNAAIQNDEYFTPTEIDSMIKFVRSNNPDTNVSDESSLKIYIDRLEGDTKKCFL